MAHGIGISVTERLAAAVIVDYTVTGNLVVEPDDGGGTNSLIGVPADTIVQRIAALLERLEIKQAPTHVGLALPGIIRNGIVEDSPNLVQFKGLNMQASLAEALSSRFGKLAVSVTNDANAMAAGMAAGRGYLDRLIRLWFLGTGIGFGRYPQADGVWEAGHSIVTLDPKEQFCGCGGKGHLEGIMGLRAMRLRFMDLEPEEVFAQAEAGENRCVEFVKLWHRALAAATATSIHMSGPGKVFITGPNAKFVSLPLVNEYLNEMVKLSPLQSYSVELVPGSEDENATIGAAVIASQAAQRA
ncbi:MAG: ROK family protein [Acidobacteriaceae bacterium]|nr:ROK family protein [Acidobacteriaceae bacterium]MBV9677738.1 ROK family protein [Acidobacteriaceae bacterium]